MLAAFQSLNPSRDEAADPLSITVYKPSMISVSEALSILSDYIPERSAETVSLNDALGRACADDIRAQVTLPPRAASAMDGYAVRLQDVREPNVSLNVIGEVPAGSSFEGVVGQKRGRKGVHRFAGPKRCRPYYHSRKYGPQR